MKPTVKARCVRLARFLLDRPTTYRISDGGGYFEAGFRAPTEEGWIDSDVIIEPLPDGWLRVTACDAGRDCDGYTSRDYTADYRERRKAQRFYMGPSPRWRRHGEKSGRLYVRPYVTRDVPREN